MAERVHCPSCGIPYEADARICTRCGIDLRTGKPLRTTVGPAEPDEDEEDSGPIEYTAWERFVMTVGAVALIAYAQGVAWILIGRFELLQEALTEFDGKAWTLFSICVWGPFVALLAVAKMVMG